MAAVTSTSLDQATVVRVAAEVADRDGWTNLTLSQVAREVDRHVTTLYAHVDSLDALRRHVALLAFDELAERAGGVAMGRTREDALRAIAEVYRDYALAHPGRVAAMHAIRVDDEPDLRDAAAGLATPIRATLRSYGLDDERVAVAHRVFSSTVLGLVRNLATDDAFDAAIRLFVLGLSSGDWP